MQITVSQLQSRHRALVDALKRGEVVELTYHGKVLGIVQPQKSTIADDLSSMDAFFGMHKDLDSSSVEEELRVVRKGRLQRDAF